MRRHLGDGFPLMADANMKWTRRPGDPRRPRLPALRSHLAGGAGDPGRRRRAMPASWPRAALPIASGENLRTLVGVQAAHRRRRRHLPEPDVTNCGGVTAFMKIARLAEAFNLPVTSHGAHDVTVQLLAAARTAPTSKRTASGSSATSPSRWSSRTAAPSRPTGRATASSSTGRAGGDPGVSERFDYIVVGGGASGCVAAARLVTRPARACCCWRPAIPTGIRCSTCRRASSR